MTATVPPVEAVATSAAKTMAHTRDELLETARRWHRLGYTPTPLACDGSKRPMLPWKHSV